MNTKDYNITISTGTILKSIGLILLFVALYYIRNIIFILLVSIVVATFVDAVVRKLKNYKIPRGFAIAMVYFFGLVMIGTIVAFVVPAFFAEIGNIFTTLSKYVPSDKLKTIIDPNLIKTVDSFVSNFGNDGSAVSQVASSTKALIAGISSTFYDAFVSLFGGIANLVLVVVISFYLSINENGIDNFLRVILPLKYEEKVISLWNRTARKIALWLRGQMMLAMFMALLTFFILTLLGVKYALLLSLIVLICELVPFGMIFATIPAALAGFASGGIQMGLVVLGIYFVLQQIEGYVLVPLINKRVNGVPPVVVILAILIGGKLAGFVGILLAMPGALFLLELSRDIEEHKENIRSLSNEIV
jgi:predicted PurR-regulated permease PerM